MDIRDEEAPAARVFEHIIDYSELINSNSWGRGGRCRKSIGENKVLGLLRHPNSLYGTFTLVYAKSDAVHICTSTSADLVLEKPENLEGVNS